MVAFVLPAFYHEAITCGGCAIPLMPKIVWHPEIVFCGVWRFVTTKTHIVVTVGGWLLLLGPCSDVPSPPRQSWPGTDQPQLGGWPRLGSKRGYTAMEPRSGTNLNAASHVVVVLLLQFEGADGRMADDVKPDEFVPGLVRRAPSPGVGTVIPRTEVADFRARR